jgi:ribulose-bisphosphate carboxylase large chain
MKEKPHETVPGSCDWVPADGREQESGASCDWSPGPPPSADSGSVLRAFDAYRWEGIEPERYKAQDGGWAAIVRQVLVAGNAGTGFDVRYFEIGAGGHSSLEKHAHAHVVIGLRGRGRVLLAGELREVGFLDVAYIAPGDPHQLLNPFQEPFGFLCLVDHDRDRPTHLDDGELSRLLAGPAAAGIRR